MLQNNYYILVIFDLDINDEVSLTTDRIIMYRTSNKMTPYQINSKKDLLDFACFSDDALCESTFAVEI